MKPQAALPKPAAQKENAFRLHGAHIKNGLRGLKLQEATRTGLAERRQGSTTAGWKILGHPGRAIRRHKKRPWAVLSQNI